LALDRSAVRQLFGFSSRLFGFQFMNYWMRNADNLLIGKFVGADALGAYNRAYMWMLMPIAQVSQVVSRVMFPALSRVQHDLPRVKRFYLRTISAIALITFPTMLGLTVVSDLFVSTVLGDNWLDVIPLLQVLGVVGMMQSIGTTTGLIYQSLGRTDLLLRWGIGSGLVTLTAFVIGLRWGALGVATAYAIRSAGLVYWNYSIPGRLIDMKVREVFYAARGAFGCALLMCLPVLALREFLPHDWPKALRLGLCVMSGAICYIVLVLTTKPTGSADLRELATSRISALRRRAVPAPSVAP
jgi:PST family polysaccharide transporter